MSWILNALLPRAPEEPVPAQAAPAVESDFIEDPVEDVVKIESNPVQPIPIDVEPVPFEAVVDLEAIPVPPILLSADSVPVKASSSDREQELNIGSRFYSCDIIVEKAQRFARLAGFVVATNSHPFLSTKPHPIHGIEQKRSQRGRIYCNYQDPLIKQESKNIIRTTCTWYKYYRFDFNSVDYVITKGCDLHNHDIFNVKITSGGLTEIKLDANLVPSEREMIYNLAKCNLPLFKVIIHYIFIDVTLPPLIFGFRFVKCLRDPFLGGPSLRLSCLER